MNAERRLDIVIAVEDQAEAGELEDHESRQHRRLPGWSPFLRQRARGLVEHDHAPAGLRGNPVGTCAGPVAVAGGTVIARPVAAADTGWGWAASSSTLGIGRFARASRASVVRSDVPAAREHFRRHGVPIQEATPIPGADRFFIFDPDGNRIEIIQWIEPYDPAASGAAELDRG